MTRHEVCPLPQLSTVVSLRRDALTMRFVDCMQVCRVIRGGK